MQEVFLQADVASLITAAESGGCSNSHRFRGGVLGGELLTLSRYPISTVRILQETQLLCDGQDIGTGIYYERYTGWRRNLQAQFEQYSVAGDPAAPHHGDFFAGATQCS